MLVMVKQIKEFGKLLNKYQVYAMNNGYVLLNNDFMDFAELVTFFIPFNIKKVTFIEYSDSWVIDELKEELKKHEH
jgi:hypothetical protein